eukprot:TRINITY_DN2411_c0_g1_i8.p3 TRINITY_DN2411_c0_g1~~TRINITY_DN2411_c0_g1_i8.p3  ORF type:complete len:126 (-),score=3.99 TRINITY_DN2411_c0_g1_i8:347-724(-)
MKVGLWLHRWGFFNDHVVLKQIVICLVIFVVTHDMSYLIVLFKTGFENIYNIFDCFCSYLSKNFQQKVRQDLLKGFDLWAFLKRAFQSLNTKTIVKRKFPSALFLSVQIVTYCIVSQDIGGCGLC